MLVQDVHLGHVTDPPAGRVKAPDEVDVLADRQVLVEPATDRGPPHEQHGARDVGDRPARSYEAALRPHVERRVARLVGGDRTARAERAHARRGGGDAWIDQMRQQAACSVLRKHDVRIDEAHERRRAGGEARVARGSRSARLRVPDDAHGLRPEDSDRGDGAVVDDDHARLGRGPLQRAQAALELLAAITDGNDERQLVRCHASGRMQLEHPGVHQAAREVVPGRPGADRARRPPAADDVGSTRCQRERPQRLAADEDPPLVQDADPRGE